MSRSFYGVPSAHARATAIAALLLICTPALAADGDPEARFRGTGKADPIRVANVRRADGPAAGQSLVQFDLAWDHSWRVAWEEGPERHGGPGVLKLESWDAAWVFLKFRKPGADGYSHATLSTNAADHAVPAGAKLEVGLSDDGKRGVGVFVYRATAGHGANDWKGVTLRWLHEADGADAPEAAETKVFAVQMVYVPECAFWVGDGSTKDVAGQFSAGDTDEPFRFEGENAIMLGGESKKHLGNRDGIGMDRAEDFTSGGTQTLPARFPKGYAGFYCMRHEITEGQYVEFLNTVNSAQQGRLAPIEQSDGKPLTGIRVAVPGKPGTPAVYESNAPHVACRCLPWSDCTASAAWAGLRPMTELEYEKACRGPLKPVPDEFAWGTVGIAGTEYKKTKESAAHDGYALETPGKPDERVVWKGANGPDASRGNAVWDGVVRREGQHGRIPADAVTRPLRAGVFATPDSGRVAAGASYWGILDLSGNLWQRVVTVGNPWGRRFTGTHGDWPKPVGPEAWGMGFGTRGGALDNWPGQSKGINDSRPLRTSDRSAVSSTTPVSSEWRMSRFGNKNMGFRCVRTAEMGRMPGGQPPLEAGPGPLWKAGAEAPTLRKPGDGRPFGKSWDDKWKVQIENVTAAPRDAKTATVTFDISWYKSWRDKNNHDAAWVFFKVRADDKADWQHVRLAADKVLNPTGYSQAEGGTPLDLIVPDGDDRFTGMFVRRAANGEGPLAARRVTAVWDLTANKGTPKDAKVSMRAFGIQMVYVPEGPFYLGSGGLEVGGFYQYTDGSQQIQPYRVTGPGAIPTGRQAGRLWVRKHGGQLEEGGKIPASFPNAYSAFYCMKCLILPEQYADFMSTLTPAQAEARFAEGAVKRAGQAPDYTYTGVDSGQRLGPGCRGLCWADGAAFAAWAGLRPMTELECEKVVRGSREPIPNEVGPSYWGVEGYGTWDWDAFKGHNHSVERPVTVGNAAGRRFKGTHGPGTLTLPADWPQDDAVGAGMRCSWYTPDTDRHYELQRTRVSDRLAAALVDPERHPEHRWRGVRTAPKGVGP
ncbi:MAG TPA: SUMF1/EgtB/PvdO family nonheme iron enzyme [Phycisphaerae bacterium]|nr:SUMF1/EgtB/PvdO family nonheme iron enzyme [Planctomycetota bacterium]HUT58897.1 SUMF1/EgtB/PvdO family nonheme iron enzyme [Phycisphaerae bacterium]